MTKKNLDTDHTLFTKLPQMDHDLNVKCQTIKVLKVNRRGAPGWLRWLSILLLALAQVMMWV